MVVAATRDPYQVLGVPKTASADDIKNAFRRQAKQLHPDVNPGRADIELRFKDLNQAYTLLSDPAKRRRFDAGELDATGAERFHRPGPGAGRGRTRSGASRGGADGFGGGFGGGFGAGFNTDDLFADLFGGGRKESAKPGAKGTDIEYTVTVSFTEAALGATRRVSLSNGKSIDVTVPPGTADQQKLRLKGQGMGGAGSAPAGDAIVQVNVEAHSFFTRQGADVLLDYPVTLPEAVLGTMATVPTLDGKVTVKIPPGSNTGTVLRLKNKGIPDAKGGAGGSLLVKLKVVLPEPPDSELVQFIERWSQNRSYDVRRKLGLE